MMTLRIYSRILNRSLFDKLIITLKPHFLLCLPRRVARLFFLLAYFICLGFLFFHFLIEFSVDYLIKSIGGYELFLLSYNSLT